MKRAGLVTGLLHILLLGCGGTDGPAGSVQGAGGSTAGAGATGGETAAGGNATAGSNAAAAGSNAMSGAGGNSAAGAAGTGSGGTAGSGGGASAYTGYVQFGWFGSATFNSLANASFAAPSTASTTTCTPTLSSGACVVSHCTTGADAPMRPNAGAIAISDGQKFSAQLSPSPNGMYLPFSQPGVSLPGGEAVTVTAAGSEVPAFSGSVTQPLALLVTVPADASAGTFSWSRTQDLVLTFQRGAAGITLVVQGGVVDGTSVDCQFATDSGTATVPSAVLAALPAATTLDLLTSASEHVQAGNYDVTLTAFASAVNSTKTRGIHVSLQ